MNRLESLELELEAINTLADAPRSGVVKSGRLATVGAESPISLFSPLHYEAGYRYPLLVWLHGSGDDERQLQRIMPFVSLRNYVAVAPRGFARAEGGCGWRQSSEEIERADQRVADCLSLVKDRLSIHPDRVFLAGFGCGGTMAFRLAMRNPHRYAGVLSLGGAFPKRHAPLAQLTQARRLKVFLASGRDSQSYRPQDVSDDLRLLHSANFHIALRQYPCGQEICPQMLSDMDRWLMEQIVPGQTG